MNDPMKLEDLAFKIKDSNLPFFECIAKERRDEAYFDIAIVTFAWFKAKLDEKDKEIEWYVNEVKAQSEATVNSDNEASKTEDEITKLRSIIRDMGEGLKEAKVTYEGTEEQDDHSDYAFKKIKQLLSRPDIKEILK